MRVCPHRLALVEQWIKAYDRVQLGDRDMTLGIALLRSIVCFRTDCSEQTCIAQIEAMSEGEYMTYVLEQVRTGKAQPYARLTDADLEAIEEEHIGEDFSRYPFLY
jgi:hypothetical protein